MTLTDVTLTGYIPGVSFRGATEIDRELAEAERCPECGGGMEYRPFYRPSGKAAVSGSYRAFAVCPVCGHAIEF